MNSTPAILERRGRALPAMCRVHHRELHRIGNERSWWDQRNIDPLPIALRFWQHKGRTFRAKSQSWRADCGRLDRKGTGGRGLFRLRLAPAVYNHGSPRHHPMISIQRLEANRRNALRSTGPRTEHGKQRSRVNAVRHRLTAETVVGGLEDAEYTAFEAAIAFDAETAVARVNRRSTRFPRVDTANGGCLRRRPSRV